MYKVSCIFPIRFIHNTCYMILSYFFYILLGFLPSLIWLLFYLHKDAHPEPKKQVLRIFYWGMLIAPLAVITEFVLFWLTAPTTDLSKIVLLLDKFNDGWRAFLTLVLFAPLVEEYLKYRIVRTEIIKNSHFDEPLDAMLYMIIGALGFASIENLIIVLRSPLMDIGQVFGIIGFRFLGATFLHALSSGIVGYFMAKYFFKGKKRFPLIIQGMAIAVILHGSYNYLITLIGEFPQVAILIAILLLSMASFVSYKFRQLKKAVAICKLQPPSAN